MSRSEDIQSLVGEKFFVGLSSALGITGIPGQLGAIVKWFAGGSMEIGVTAGGGWGQGYQFSAGETVNLNCVGTFYLVATGATATAMVLRGRTAGF